MALISLWIFSDNQEDRNNTSAPKIENKTIVMVTKEAAKLTPQGGEFGCPDTKRLMPVTSPTTAAIAVEGWQRRACSFPPTSPTAVSTADRRRLGSGRRTLFTLPVVAATRRRSELRDESVQSDSRFSFVFWAEGMNHIDNV